MNFTSIIVLMWRYGLATMLTSPCNAALDTSCLSAPMYLKR